MKDATEPLKRSVIYVLYLILYVFGSFEMSTKLWFPIPQCINISHALVDYRLGPKGTHFEGILIQT